MDNQLMLNEFRNNNKVVISEVYKKFRSPFLAFVIRKYSIDMETAKEIYQESFLIFHNNIINGKLTQLTANLKTYLFQIGRNILNNEFRRSNRLTEIADIKEHNFSNGEEINFDSENSTESRKRLIRDSLKELGKKCIEILMLFYFQNMKYEEMMPILNYSNIDSLKTQKYKCFKKLESEVKKRMEENKIEF
jgi:RNA polymerase sigma factor (sigma-70 family)